MIIKVLGTGCANCKKAKRIARSVVADLGIDATIEEVTDMKEIMSYGFMTTPGIVINEKLVGSGGVPTPQQMAALIKKEM